MWSKHFNVPHAGSIKSTYLIFCTICSYCLVPIDLWDPSMFFVLFSKEYFKHSYKDKKTSSFHSPGIDSPTQGIIMFEKCEEHLKEACNQVLL